MAAQFPSSAVVDATGAASITFGPTVTSVAWIISQVSVQLASATPNAIAEIILNGQIVTATNNGSLDSADGYPYVRLTPDDRFSVQWTGATPGTVAYASIYYDEVAA